MNDVRSPAVLGHSAIFSAKLKSLRRTDAPELGVDNPFPFLFDGREMEVGQENVLENSYYRTTACWPSKRIFHHILSQGGVLRNELGTRCRCGQFTFWPKPTSFHFVNPTILHPVLTKGNKRQGDALISPRKNKRVGQIVEFSDDE